MIPLDLSGKVALVTGVGDNESFAWYIAKALQAAGARLLFAVHPRMIEHRREHPRKPRRRRRVSRVLPFGAGTLKVEKVLPCDVSYDTMADVPEATRDDRRYTRLEKHGDYSIAGDDRNGPEADRRHRHPDPQRRLQPGDQEQGRRHQPGRLPERAEHQRLFADRACCGRRSR